MRGCQLVCDLGQSQSKERYDQHEYGSGAEETAEAVAGVVVEVGCQEVYLIATRQCSVSNRAEPRHPSTTDNTALKLGTMDADSDIPRQ